MKTKKPSKKFSILEKYRNCWKYLQDSRKYILVIVAIFFTFILIGYFVPVPESISQWISDYIREVVSRTDSMSASELISFIFLNNLKSSFFGMVLGSLLGIFSVFISLFNGYILGFVLKASISAEGFLVVWKLLPHGIFELPAIFMALGLGLRLGTDFLFNRKNSKFKKNFYSSLNIFLFIILPLLLIAAVIEGILISFVG